MGARCCGGYAGGDSASASAYRAALARHGGAHVRADARDDTYPPVVVCYAAFERRAAAEAFARDLEARGVLAAPAAGR